MNVEFKEISMSKGSSKEKIEDGGWRLEDGGENREIPPLGQWLTGSKLE